MTLTRREERDAVWSNLSYRKRTIMTLQATQQLKARAEQAASKFALRAVRAVNQAVDATTTSFGEAFGEAHPASGPNRNPTSGAARSGFTALQARQIGEMIGINWASAPFDVEQFRIGIGVELEHGFQDATTNVTDDDPTFTGKIALAHLNEFADYYTRLERMEEEAKHDIASQRTNPGHPWWMVRRPASHLKAGEAAKDSHDAGKSRSTTRPRVGHRRTGAYQRPRT